MIVQMCTLAQAEKVAAATGGVQLAGKPDKDGTPTPVAGWLRWRRGGP